MKLGALVSGLAVLAASQAMATPDLGNAYNYRSTSLALQGGVGSLNSFSPGGGIFFGPATALGIEFEKGVGFDGLYINGALNDVRSSGSASYSYQSSSALYLLSPANFSWEEYQLALGLRYKFFEDFPVQPFLGMGLTGGYSTITYGNSLSVPAITMLGSDYRVADSALDFGHFIEAGFSFYFTHLIGMRLRYVYLEGATRPFDTLKKQMVTYSANLAYLTLFIHF